MSTLLQTEAIVLHALAFREYDRILTLFTPQGLIKLLVKIKKRDYLHFAALTAPLTQAEFHYTKGKKDLHRFQNGTILSQHIHIRDTYERLSAANMMMQALQQSQWHERPAPDLYTLFTLFLRQLPQAEDPYTLASAFLLKIMRHEGLLQLSPSITACARFAGERYAAKEGPIGSEIFTEDEETQLIELVISRSLSHIGGFRLQTDFQRKVANLFEQAFSE